MSASIARAMLREQFQRTLPLLVLCLGITSVSCLTLYFAIWREAQASRSVDVSSDAGFAVGTIGGSLMLCIVTLLFCHSDDRDLTLNMPGYLFRLPVRTFDLVFWRMGYGLLFVSTVAVVSSTVYYLLFSPEMEAEMAFWAPLRIAVTLFACLQAVAWCVGGSGPAMILVTLLLYWLINWLAFHFPVSFFDPTQYTTELVLSAVATSYVVSYIGVRLHRREGINLAGILDPLFSAISRDTAADPPPFASPEAAMRWFEWRRQGWKFPVFVVLFSITLAVIGIRTNHIPEVLGWPPSTIRAFTAQIVAFSFNMALILAVFGFGSYCLFQNQRIQSGPQKTFLFIRPVSTRALASARISVTLRSLLFGMVPIVIASLVYIALALQSLDEVGIKAMLDRYAGYQAPVIAVFLLVGLFGILWCIQWSGNALALLAIFAIPTVVLEIVHEFYPLGSQRIETYALIATAIVAIPTAAYLFHMARREGLLDGKLLVPWLIVWPFILGGFLTLFNWINLDDGNRFVLLGEAAPVLAAAVLPILPLATVPLIMKYARHR